VHQGDGAVLRNQVKGAKLPEGKFQAFDHLIVCLANPIT
jgi:hypothetical protein